MVTRILSAVVLAPLFFVVLFFLPPVFLAVLLACITARASFELLRATKVAHHNGMYVYTAAAAGLIPLTFWLGWGNWSLAALSLLLMAALFLGAIRRFDSGSAISLEDLLVCMFGGIVIPAFLSTLVLLKGMEDHRDDLIVIVAGYTELMEEFVHSNPGLESRFNRFLNFPDYTVQEMMDIFDMRCRKSGYELAEDARGLLRSLLALLSLDVKGFGNARGVRNLFERTVAAQANRLAALPDVTREMLMTLTADDLRAAEGGQLAEDDLRDAEREVEEEAVQNGVNNCEK